MFYDVASSVIELPAKDEIRFFVLETRILMEEKDIRVRMG